jgi:hypothetical protein
VVTRAHPVAATATCPGDCNGDGAVGIDELVAAVAAALGSSDPLRCDEFDLDADGIVSVHELVSLVGSALNGCPGPFDPALVDGVYDTEVRSQTDPSGGGDRSGIAVVAALSDGLHIELHNGLLESYWLLGTLLGDGSITVSGNGTVGGEFAVTVTGDLRLTERGDVVELRGVLGFKYDIAPVGSLLDAVFTRARSGTAADYSGVQHFTLRHPLAAADAVISRIDLPISAPPSGRATCGAAADLLTDGRVRAELPETECLVSSSGRFLYMAPYRVADPGTPLPLQMWGGIGAAGGPVGRGTFAVAAFPEVAETGVWQAEQAPGTR